MTIPKVTRPGTDIDICITIWKKGSGNVNIATALRNNNGQTITGISKTYAGTSGKLHMLKLKVPSDTPSGYNYHLDTICTGWIVFSKTIGNIQVDSKNASMFIQTDRPIYKPGDLVQFRAFGMKPSLDVIKAPIDVIIFDPLKNRVKQYLKLQEEYGVVSGFFHLSPETHHGRWTIEMKQLGQTQKEYIEVKEYVLPKFDVQVSVPGFNFVQDDFVTVRVSAVYTFGKPVEGYALINVTRADRSDSIFVKFEKIHGKVDIKIPMWFLYPSFGTSYSLFVKVNETVTGKEANDTTIFQLYTSKTKVVFSQSMPSTFKPGLKYTIMLRIEKSDGSSIESPLGTAKIIITYKYSVKVKESITTKTKLFFTKAVAVDKSGVVIQQVSFPKHAESGTVYVTMEFDKKTVEPGQAVNLKVKADPGSLVNILAVDKSVLLLGNANDITANNVLTKLQGFTSTPVPLLREWDSIGSVVDSGVDSKTVFTNSNLFICKTNGAMPAEKDDGKYNVPVEKTNRNGVASLKSLVPDTITQWIATSFVVNPQSGLGVAAESANIITYQRFFMRFELPYSAIRGETLILQITVFNYRNEDLQVHVNLNKNVNLTFVDVKGNIVVPKGTAWTKILFVPKDTVKSVYFPIIPTKIGSTLLDASVRSTAAADAVQRPLLVKMSFINLKPEGIRENYNIPVVIDLRRKRKFSAKVRITFPDFVIPDSQFIKISVIGDLIGTTLAGVEDLLRMSYGCGEQNLVRFVPNVFISVYLKSTNRLTNDIKDKVDRYLSAGYQRQLSYAHVDGSFSAFGKSDRYGSTWLTAFVVKSFAQAALLTYIDPNVMRKAVRFLINNQIKETGEYKEKGVVYQKSMQGGSASSAASLTSYVVIALHEALTRKQIPDDAIKTTQESIKDAVSFIIRILENRTLIAKNNQFELVIATYALTLVDARISRALLRQIERYSSRKDGTKFWKLTDDAANMIQPYVRWTPPKTKVRALDIEMTSYVLLIYNIRKDITNGVQVVKWLNKQKNPFGGFTSTQDTVIAIQAITGFAEKTFLEQFNAVLTVKGDSWTGHTFTVDNTNSLVLHSVDAPRSIQQISIDCAGSGFLMSEVAVFFNVPEELTKPAFDLNTTVLNDSVLGFRLKLCFSWLRGGNSTMGYMEIALPTGMEADMESMNTTRTYGLYKKREASSDHLNLYFDWITTKEMCVEINIDRVNLVAKQKPVPARLSEYYEQSNEVIRMYESKVLSQASAEDVCGLDRCQ
ncbi:CD109 [Mytilus edulis]|uniref:CD109 n=1 Tax=Mytilus edulis TaxID=6550 RepID=A0A8S3QD12_MYTED|nr:CD109 [Mytilus edulis]